MDNYCKDCLHNEVCRYDAYCPRGHCNDKCTIDDLRLHGVWIKDGVGLFKCSLCSRRICTDISNDKPYIDFPFCHCGAAMSKGEAE